MTEDIIINYRDPLVGVITIFLIIFVASFVTYTVNIYNERKSRKEYRKLLERFELGTLKEDDYIHLYSTYNLPFDSIILLQASPSRAQRPFNFIIGVLAPNVWHPTFSNSSSPCACRESAPWGTRTCCTPRACSCAA